MNIKSIMISTNLIFVSTFSARISPIRGGTSYYLTAGFPQKTINLNRMQWDRDHFGKCGLKTTLLGWLT